MGYYFSTPTGNVQPYVFWAQNSNKPFPITIFLPNIFTGTPTTPITQASFTLTTTTSTDPVKVPYKITVPANSPIWTFDNTPIRPVYNDFLQFLILLEKQGLQPGGLELVRLALAQYLPLTFAETLFYRYSLHPTNGYVDLQPGMRVRLDYQVHQAVDPAQNYLNGFVGSGTSYLDVVSVASGTNLLTAFNPFLASMQHTAVSPNQGGAAGPIDISGAAFAYPYFRLFYPQNFTSSDSTGSVGVGNNVALLGAGSLTDLTAATTTYVNNGNFTGAPGVNTFFRGRVTVTPEVQLAYFGTPTYVPLGSTVRQLLRGFTVLPHMVGLIFVSPSQFFYRWMTADYTSPNTWKFPALLDGLFNFGTGSGGAYQVYSPTVDSLDLPVQGGDYLSLNLPSG